MKKSKAEIFLETWLITLEYLNYHKIQGRIFFSSISLTILFLILIVLLLVLKFCAAELVTIIRAFQCIS